MASRTEDWGLPDRGRNMGVCVFLLGESAASLSVGTHSLRGVAIGPGLRVLTGAVLNFCFLVISTHCGAISCGHVIEALAITLWSV